MLSVDGAVGHRRHLTQMGIGQGAEATWVVMADPDGNEFCVLRAFTAGERATP